MTEMFTGLCDRLAAEGFVALVPDLYGGRTAATIEEAETLVNNLKFADAKEQIAAAADHLLADPQVRGSFIGSIGFSLGASLLSWFITAQPAVSAAVFFYGGSEGNEDLAQKTRAAILGHFAETDEWEPPAQETLRLGDRLRDAGLDLTFHVYPGTGHWFFEENRPDAYNPAAAQLAWERTVAFLRERLRSEPPDAADETTTLLSFLDRQRATFAWKCSGLDAAGLRATLGPSSMTLGGMLKHLAHVEDAWFSRSLHGRGPRPPWDTVDWKANPDWEWSSAAKDSPEELFALWHDAVARSRTLVAEALAERGLERPATGITDDRGVHPTLRYVLITMIEEYNRHNGHADLIRESVDGLVGQDPPS
jgi:dienelactone hydrolase